MANNNSSNNNNRGGKNGKNGGFRGVLTLIAWALVLTVAFQYFNAYNNNAANKSTSHEIKYSDMISMIEKDQVKEILFKDSTIYVTPVDGYVFTEEVTSGSKTETKTYTQSKDSGLTLYTVYLSNADLLPLLEAHNVAYTGFYKAEMSPFLMIMIQYILPTIFIVGAFMLVMRLMSKSGGGGFGGIGSVGKANAKVYMEKSTGVTFKDVAGQDEAKESLEEIIDFLHNPGKYTAIGAKLPKGALLVGSPGTGKTLLAKAVAGEAGVPFFSISGSDFVEMFVGVGASRVRDLFKEAAKVAPCIIFIDEIDTIGKSRDGSRFGGNDEREQTLNQLLVEMDGFDNDTNLIIIAATNRPDVLDPALLRPGRFDRQVGVAAPDLEGREAILRVHAKGKPFVPDVDLHMVAVRTPGFTGADLANVLNEAALLCARAGAQLIDNRAIDEAIDRVQAGPKRKSKGMALEELRNTAYHEGGHALVAAALNNTDPVTKVTILPRGRALGYTAVMPTSDRYSQSRNQLLDQMAYAMGGRTAEEIVFHDPTTGASNDIEKATSIARTMVIEYGFSDKLGAIKWGSDDDQTTVMDGLQPRKYSDRTAEVIDDEVLKLVETAHTEAWTIINDNRDILDELVRQLLVKETLNEKELAEIFAPIKKAPVRPVWLSNDRRPDSDKPPVEIPESLKRSVGMKPEE